jgi:hypothetical protein
VISLLLLAMLEAQDPGIAQATDLVLPAVPASALLDVNPATVTQPGFAKDMKLDLFLRGDRLAPDLAFAVKPVWMLAYGDVDVRSYREQSRLRRALATLSASVGTAKPDSLSRIAWALTLSVKRHDPLLDSTYTRLIGRTLEVTDEQQRLEGDRALLIRDSIANAAEIELIGAALEALYERVDEGTKAAEAAYRKLHWNESAIDVGFGRVLSYADTSLADVRFSGNGWGAWAAASAGFGTRSWLFTALGRIGNVDGEQTLLAGANARLGGEAVNGFAELVAERSGGTDEVSIAYGGEYRVEGIGKIEFGIRTPIEDDFTIGRVRPMVKVHWALKALPL